nr:hypothetical protein [Bradyrhizobium paxllaeri]
MGRTLGEFSGGLDRQLVLDVREVGFDRLDAPAKDPRNLARGPTLTHKAKYLQLAVAEHADRRGGFEAPAADILLRQPPLQRFAHVSFAGEHLADGRQYGLIELMLGDITESACAEGALGIDRFIVNRKHQRGNAGMARLDFLDEIQAILIAKHKIDNHQIWRSFPDGLKRSQPRADGIMGGEAGLRLDQGHQSAT